MADSFRSAPGLGPQAQPSMFANIFATQPVAPSQFHVKPILDLGNGDRFGGFVTIPRREYEELLESKQHLERTLEIIEHLEARCAQQDKNMLGCTESYRRELARVNNECEAKCAYGWLGLSNMKWLVLRPTKLWKRKCFR